MVSEGFSVTNCGKPDDIISHRLNEFACFDTANASEIWVKSQKLNQAFIGGWHLQFTRNGVAPDCLPDLIAIVFDGSSTLGVEFAP